jgi:aspartate/methionine/tyrosine aminotransferase
MEREGRDVIWLTTGEPDFVTPDFVREATTAALDAGHTHYVPAAGIPELRTAIAAEESVLQDRLAGPDQVVVTSGSYQALFCTLMATVNPGDEVLLTDPGFGPYANLVHLAGGTPVYFPTWDDSRKEFALSAEVVSRYITPRTKVLILNNPWNPTGRVFNETELSQLAAVCERHNLLVLLDQVYRSLVYEPNRYLSLARFLAENTVVIDSFSKSFAMTGWRLGYAVCPNKKLAGAVAKVNQVTARCATSFVQYGALAAYRKQVAKQEALRKMRAAYTDRRELLTSKLGSTEGLHFSIPEGAFYLYCNVAGSGLSSEEFAEELLEKWAVAVSAGSFFGPSGKDFIRLSFATGLDLLEIAADRLKNFFGQIR